MTDYIRKEQTVDAVQFDGSEGDAEVIIAWAAEYEQKLTRVHVKGSWNDQHPTLALRAGDEDELAGEGSWLVWNSLLKDIEVYDNQEFELLFREGESA